MCVRCACVSVHSFKDAGALEPGERDDVPVTVGGAVLRNRLCVAADVSPAHSVLLSSSCTSIKHLIETGAEMRRQVYTPSPGCSIGTCSALLGHGQVGLTCLGLSGPAWRQLMGRVSAKQLIFCKRCCALRPHPHNKRNTYRAFRRCMACYLGASAIRTYQRRPAVDSVMELVKGPKSFSLFMEDAMHNVIYAVIMLPSPLSSISILAMMSPAIFAFFQSASYMDSVFKVSGLLLPPRQPALGAGRIAVVLHML